MKFYNVGAVLGAAMERNAGLSINRPHQINEDGDFSEWTVWGDMCVGTGPTLEEALWNLMKAVWDRDDMLNHAGETGR